MRPCRRATMVALIVAIGLGACAEREQEMVGHETSALRTEPTPNVGLDGAAAQLAVLEHRKTLVEDANAIKRLQRAYGYYLDEALWDELVDLFVEDGTIEIGLDGVYAGRARIREYLYALGGGRASLPEGALSEHMQLMPVVTVAPDGRSARGRWRAILMIGELGGGQAIWGEGPYENEYVKEDGVWKLKSVHWYQSMVVPYEGGWQVNPDVNGGKWVSDALPPDRPPTVEYETWPGTYLPPFHFPNPVLGAVPVDVGAFADLSRYAAAGPETLARETARLAHEVQLLEDKNAIERLQRIYGFYIDKGFWSEAASLFADDATIEVAGSGVFVGKARVLEYLRSRGPEFPRDGRLFDRMQLQPIVHVAPDGRTAKGRWRLFAQEAIWHEFASWGVGVYENEYVKDNGVWKIRSLRVHHTMYTPYADGWGKTALPNAGPSDALPPDRPPTFDYAAYPAANVFAFHYENPVTGDPVYAASPASYAAVVDTTAMGDVLDALTDRVLRLEDAEQLERMNAIYGYYLARNQWDDLAGIFSREGTIEIAMRGVYAGPASVRRNLNLYGEQGIQHGLLHNHMQYQPVIDIAADGRSAQMRSRALSIMGEYETYSMWMGGVYENDYIKEDGIWKLQHDQVFNTYFVPYGVGWKEAVPRPPPGISESNPPDAPPTHPFEMYPTAFVPPFHYPNPVTGRRVVWPPSE